MDYSIALATLKQADPILGEVIDRIGDCTLGQEPRQGELLDALAESIIYQQLSGKAAAAIHRRFLLLYPELTFLTPDAILNTSDEALRGVGLSRSKVLYIKDLAQRIQLGLPTVAQLEVLNDEEIIRLLTQVKGIGRWTAQMLLIFRMHRWDVLPVDDLGIRTAIRNLYRLEDLPDKKTTERIGQAWKPYQTIASWYLWRSLDP
ncbi:MAG TPA: DNA-3-methyladenine glycosylase [Coleofasciculaceae cyanobacterium]|jgi:DNA-3-methyladenine glycosylase II